MASALGLLAEAEAYGEPHGMDDGTAMMHYWDNPNDDLGLIAARPWWAGSSSSFASDAGMTRHDKEALWLTAVMVFLALCFLAVATVGMLAMLM